MLPWCKNLLIVQLLLFPFFFLFLIFVLHITSMYDNTHKNCYSYCFEQSIIFYIYPYLYMFCVIHSFSHFCECFSSAWRALLFLVVRVLPVMNYLIFLLWKQFSPLLLKVFSFSPFWIQNFREIDIFPFQHFTDLIPLSSGSHSFC